ncbi:MAG: hypothetical protein GY754_43345 [bacterium]|nr:hypothetical protein [bacterium]
MSILRLRKKTRISVSRTEPLEAKNTRKMTAGIAKVDITPPPGMPMSGYSTFSSTGMGYRSKIMARVLYLKPKKGRPIALVQCDFLAGSILLHHTVAEYIAGKTDVEFGGLVLAASHTHSAPGNIYGSNLYNVLASNAQGFEEKYLTFCTERIGEAIISAYAERRPARAATGTTEIWGVTRNRSFPAYLRNREVANEETKKDWDSSINPYLHMIRVDCLDKDKKYKPACAFTNFSLHPNTNPTILGKLYSGDITGYTERVVEWELKKRYKPGWMPIHAAANYTHGDNNPSYSQERDENFSDLHHLGGIIAEKVLELFTSLDKKLKDTIDIEYRAKEIDLLEESACEGVSISKKPVAGFSSMGGAAGRGRSTPMALIPPFKPGIPRFLFKKGEHGPKRKITGIQLLFQRKDYPRKVMMQLVRVADTLLIPLPWEVGYEIGRRISEGVRKRAEKEGYTGITRYVIADTSNGYFGYVTTPEEYTLQYYEGGSNFYGPNTGDYIRAQASSLMEDLAKQGPGSELPEKWDFNLVTKNFYPPELLPQGARKVVREPVYVEKKEGEESFWSFRWYDVPPAKIEFHKPLIRLEVSTNRENWNSLEVEGVPVDDDGWDISTKYLKKKTGDNMALYETRWHNPVKRNGMYYRFAVMERQDREIFYSPVFQ